MPTTTNNKHYWMAFNEDYRKGGRYADLANSEFVLLIKIQAHCDEQGAIRQLNNGGYNQSELSDLFGIDRFTLKKALLSLQSRGIITIDDNQVITMPAFTYNQSERLKQPEKQVQARIAKAKSQQRAKDAESEHMAVVRAINELNKAIGRQKYKECDGKIIDTSTGQIYIPDKDGDK